MPKTFPVFGVSLPKQHYIIEIKSSTNYIYKNLKLLSKALDFAKEFSDITDTEIEIIMHARKSLLFSDGEIWIKKGDELFDVTMGSFDGAEICELVGLFLLFALMQQFGKECVGLYRDDGLAVFQNMSGPEADRTRKKIIKVFHHL